MESTIKNRRTVEQLANDTHSKKIRLQPAVVGTGADQKPLCFKDKDGNSTGIQKISVINEAGNTLGWASKAICADIQNGTFQKGKDLVVLDSEGMDENNKVVSFVTLSYAGENKRAFDLDSLYQ